MVETYRDKLDSRLYNWKFRQALSYLARAKKRMPKEVEVVTALAQKYGNIGWVCMEANLDEDVTRADCVLIAAALDSIALDRDNWIGVPEKGRQ